MSGRPLDATTCPHSSRAQADLAERNSAAACCTAHWPPPRQQVAYHPRELEKTGLAKLIEERRKGNCIVRDAARSYVISPESVPRTVPQVRQICVLVIVFQVFASTGGDHRQISRGPSGLWLT